MIIVDYVCVWKQIRILKSNDMIQLLVTLEENALVEDIKEVIQLLRGVDNVTAYKDEASGNK